jgi:hypothetical protein
MIGDRMKMVKRLNPETGDFDFDWLYFLDGKEVTEAEYRARYPMPESRAGDIVGGTPLRGWPMRDKLGFAVHPDQVDEANDRNREHGVNVVSDRATGDAIIPDRAERRRLLKLEGKIDRNSYSGY